MKKSEKSELHYLKVILPRAQAFGEAVATEWFVGMLNPVERGPTWEWSGFKAQCVRMTRAMAWQSFSEREWKAHKDAIVKAAVHAAELRADWLLERSQILVWGSLRWRAEKEEGENGKAR